jgi:membrane associated rhomboid family serine protease
MLYEYALISVLIASGYWGWYFLRHQPNGTPLFGAMQLIAALLSGLGLLGRKYDHEALGVAGAIGVGGGMCLLVLGPLVRGAARRLAASERIGLAARLLDVADLLAPGSGVAEEKALLGAMKEIREGRVEHTVDALTAAKDRAPADARLVIDERIAMLYLAAYRWSDAIAHAEAHLIPSLDPQTARDGVPRSLRDALGIAPPVWVELLGAYGRTGDLDRAARMMARLENVCSGREDGALWLHRARLMFLALAGRPAAVRALVEPRHARHMSPAARTYWVAVAHEHSGDRDAATAAYEKARKRSRGRPRQLIDEALAKLSRAEAVTLSPEATDVVSFVEAAPRVAPVKLPRTRGPWTTWGVTASLLVVAAVISFTIGDSSDPGVLLRGGALVRGRVDAGEWWRLVSCVFVHVGMLHLAVNAIGMFFLGRIAEELYGSPKTLAIFGLAGIAGAAASYLGSPVGVSAGASGAIFGVLGAVFVELTLYRDRYRAAWKRGMWGGLVVITVAQAGIGLLYPVIDQWAHGGGLLAGVVFGALLSPNTRWSKLAGHAGRVLAVAFAGVAVTAAVMVARTSIADSLDGPRVRHVIGDIAVTAPASWTDAPELSDPDGVVIVSMRRAPLTSPTVQIAGWIAGVDHAAKERGFDTVANAPDRVIPLPPGWEGSELIASFEDGMEFRQRYRLIAAGRAFGDTLIVVVIYAPDTVMRAAPPLFVQLLGSLGPA